MKKQLFFTGICFFLSVVFSPIAGSAEPSVSAKAALVLEQSSGRVLYQKNADAKLPMASTTKIMTAMVALEKGNIEEKIKISSSAAGVEGSSMYLEAGEILTLRELLYGLMLSSGNDAAVAIAEHFGGIEPFVALMNQKAAEIGATNTHFTNPNGLPDEAHYSTARDMAIITASGLNNPLFAEIVSTKTFSISGEGKAHPRTLSNHNKLLRLCEGCIGVKTGFTKAAGRCLVSAAKREGMTLVCVTLQAPDDWNDHLSLYETLFAKYHLAPILHDGIPLDSIAVENSDINALPLTAAEDFSYPVAEGECPTTTLTLSPPLSAPIADRTESGCITVELGGTPIKTLPLVTIGSAERQSFLEKQGGFLQKILAFLKNLW